MLDELLFLSFFFSCTKETFIVHFFPPFNFSFEKERAIEGNMIVHDRCWLLEIMLPDGFKFVSVSFLNKNLCFRYYWSSDKKKDTTGATKSPRLVCATGRGCKSVNPKPFNIKNLCFRYYYCKSKTIGESVQHKLDPLLFCFLSSVKELKK